MTATDTTRAQVTRSGVDRRAIPDAALELADILGTIRGLRASAGACAAAVLAHDHAECRYWIGQAEALRDIDERISKRIEALTGRTE